ncbi:hypothetical protein [Paenibacillus marinisediminis]
MPYNKAERIHQQRNKARFAEQSITLKSYKAARRAPSLNNISKQEK